MQSSPILLVDDNPDDIVFTLRAFAGNEFGNEIIVAHSGIEALELLLPENGGAPLQPAITLLDLDMPKVSGLEVLQRLRSNPLTRLLTIIMLTTSNEERDITESYRLGANSFIRKSLTLPEFVEAARVLGTYWLTMNEHPTTPRP
jgi:two-component system response regulator